MAGEFGLRHASTGEIFREAVGADTELGRTVRAYLDRGELVPDEHTNRVVRELVLERFADYILDGYPRTIGQAQDLQVMLEQREDELDAVLHFELDEETSARRLAGRLVCRQCGANFHREFMRPAVENVCDRCGAPLSVRSDSTEEIVRRRWTEYMQKTRPLVPYYEERGLLRSIEASQGPDNIAREARSVLGKLTRH
jgi:adenylate kinase